MKNKLRWDNLTSLELKELSLQNAIVLLPIGSIEQHGPHLPVGCDTILATEISEKVCKRLLINNIPAVVAPSLSVCNSKHHMSFSGSMSLSPRTFITVLEEYCNSIAAHSFKRIVLVNGHGGNEHPIQTAIIDINEKLQFPIYQVNYYENMIPKDGINILETQDGMYHACEGETSLMLAINENLVDDVYKQTSGNTGLGNELEDSGKIKTFHKMESHTLNGVMGNSYSASRYKGERLIETVVENLYEILSKEELWRVMV